ncbi:MAG: FecCD family ABC transporter permease [Bacteroidota bacterium]
MKTPKYSKYFLSLVLLLLLSFIFSISTGSSELGIRQVFNIIFGNENREEIKQIFFDFRLSKAVTALCCGSALSVCGLLMQTLFRNPLAGPYVLGVTSGSGLFISVFLIGISSLGMSRYAELGLPVFGVAGALFSLIIILLFSFRIKNNSTLLLVGIMLGFVYSAIQMILEYFSIPSELKNLVIWNMGNIGNLNWSQLSFFIPLITISVFWSLTMIKPLNAFMFGDDYAQSMGINIKKIKLFVIILTGVISGICVSYCGPIAFVGLITPHVCRLIFKSGDHRILIPGAALAGGIILLFCDAITGLFSETISLPINAITSIIGAPIVIWMLASRKNQMS